MCPIKPGGSKRAKRALWGGAFEKALPKRPLRQTGLQWRPFAQRASEKGPFGKVGFGHRFAGQKLVNLRIVWRWGLLWAAVFRNAACLHGSSRFSCLPGLAHILSGICVPATSDSWQCAAVGSQRGQSRAACLVTAARPTPPFGNAQCSNTQGGLRRFGGGQRRQRGGAVLCEPHERLEEVYETSEHRNVFARASRRSSSSTPSFR